MIQALVSPPEAQERSGPSVRLLGLLVGIDQYRRVRPLRGPVADVHALTSYLRSRPEFRHDLLLLTDADATKPAVVDGFRNHLAKAGPDDTILFYFSGHGAQEEADRSLWPTETDGRLECLVCHDGEAEQPWEFMLADKELRFLLRQAADTGAHIVTVFDCCHSGDNTRNYAWLESALAEQDVRERRLSQTAPRRPYEGFLFSDRVTEADLKAQGPETALPQGRHVQLAACESDESAVEINGEGIFTKNLLKVLQASGGAVSYGSLHNRVRQYMRFGYEQRPRIYGAGEAADSLLQKLFLNRPGTADRPSVEVSYNPRQGWLLDVGAIHGVGTSTGEIRLLDSETNQTVAAAVETVGPDYTVLAMPDAARRNLLKDRTYTATVDGLLTRTIRLHLTNTSGSPEEAARLLAALIERAESCFTPEENETRADYTLHVRDGLYYLTRPQDEYRPVVRPIPTDDPGALSQLVQFIRHLARWHFLRDLRNPEAVQGLLNLEVVPSGSAPVSITNDSQDITTPFQEKNGRWSVTMEVRLTNPTDRPVYCNALYLSRDFMSFTGLLAPNTRLEPGRTLTLGLADPKSLTGRRTSVTLQLEEVVRQYNWPEVTEHFQFLLTADPLSETTLAFLTLEALPSPPTLQDRQQELAVRGAMVLEDEEAGTFPTWWTQQVTLHLPNPLHNRVQAAELGRRLEPALSETTDTFASDVLADFTLGLYYDLLPGTSWTPDLQLKPEIVLIAADPAEKGLWMDIKLAVANRIASRMRMRQYEQTLIRYPDRLRMVAEGDSWFQYPFLVRDIIDYLSGVYNIHCLSAAGDLLTNYLAQPKFLEAIAQVKPTFFLLSGGGNDILGEQFRTYLRDRPDPTLPFPGCYLNDSLLPALDKLQETHRRIFRQVGLGHPEVHILVHGYDYIIPIDTVAQPGKSSWLGRYMIERGIPEQSEREAVIRYILDEFNRRLEAVAAEFPRVSYLDLRGTVRRTERLEDYWYDEIHPNDKGFLSVASKFVQRINGIRKMAVGTSVNT
ncbi:caspase family protein [Larkinella soli]|uniref:caspase family protein n=1 Tax=Larkinella soli TaxID=1770527 RepID=UPI000FFBF305|nr:caspase family protein [Larkinella soli]